MSLRIIINNQEARLPESCEIELKLSNTFFNDREEDATYPLTLNIAANRHIFTFADRFNSDDFIIKYPAKVYFGPYCLLDGHCIVTDISGSEIELFISTANTSFWATVKGIRLTDSQKLNLGEETFSSIDSMMTAFTESMFGGKDYVVCPLYDPYMNKIHILSPYLNSLRYFYNPLLPPWRISDDAKDAVYTTQIGGQLDKHCVFTPFVRLSKLITKVLTALKYQIIHNDLDNDTMFNDVIVVCRANGKAYPSGKASFSYNKRVPDILVSEFLQEIENKFGVQFNVNEASKKVSIISNNRPSKDIHVEATDLLQKYSIDLEDQRHNFIFKDKNHPDTYIAKYYDKEQLVSGFQEDAETIECISNVVGWSCADTVFEGRTNHMAVSEPYADDQEYLKIVRSEFRLSVYRGYIFCNEDGLHEDGSAADYAPYPIASAEPLITREPTNDMSLLWRDVRNNLYDKYHDKRIEFIKKINREYQFILKHSVNDLINFHNYFSSCLMIRNQRYRCYEINIKLSNTKIIEHIVKCYPA